MQPDTAKPPTPPAPPATPQPASCANCGAPLYGKYCYACGQSATGMVRHFSSVASDIADSVLNLDERVFKTLLPLYLRPGQLTLDYFAGKRARYVTPFRLVFFLAIIAFFALQLSFRVAMHNGAQMFAINQSGIHAVSPQDLPTNQDTHFANGEIKFNHVVLWDAHSKPLRVAWLPGVANDWLNELIDNARGNLHRMNSGNPNDMQAEGRLMMAGMFAVAPTVLFVLLPFFALMLKIFYLFKHRLYMEHLIVAMHSHAFLMLSMLVLVLLGALHGLIAPHAGWITALPFGLLAFAAWVWLFVYLLLMQKRVYAQGWIMTCVKFWCIGWCYTILVSFGMAFAFLISLTGA